MSLFLCRTPGCVSHVQTSPAQWLLQSSHDKPTLRLISITYHRVVNVHSEEDMCFQSLQDLTSRFSLHVPSVRFADLHEQTSSNNIVISLRTFVFTG